MEMSMMRKVMMDIAVPQMTGGPLASSVEECVCPPEYSGASCEMCSGGHHREEGNCVSLDDRPTEPPPYNPRVRPMRPGQLGQAVQDESVDHRGEEQDDHDAGHQPRPEDGRCHGSFSDRLFLLYFAL